MNFKQIEPLLAQLTEQQQRVMRYRYDQGYTRPYIAAYLGVSIQQVMIEELAAFTTLVNNLTKKKKAKSPGRARVVGSKQTRTEAAGPSETST